MIILIILHSNALDISEVTRFCSVVEGWHHYAERKLFISVYFIFLDVVCPFFISKRSKLRIFHACQAFELRSKCYLGLADVCRQKLSRKTASGC
jgi:hypothetical protein